MSYSELIHTYFERSVALQWYWTIYIIVIGGVLGFSTFRQRPELVTTALVTILYACFAYKNWGAIEATAEEREAILSAIKEYPDSAKEYPVPGVSAADVKRLRGKLEPKLTEYDIAGARYFHIACDLLTVAFLWAKEWRRRKPEMVTAT
jgi:hypothetical protein